MLEVVTGEWGVLIDYSCSLSMYHDVILLEELQSQIVFNWAAAQHVAVDSFLNSLSMW